MFSACNAYPAVHLIFYALTLLRPFFFSYGGAAQKYCGQASMPRFFKILRHQPKFMHSGQTLWISSNFNAFHASLTLCYAQPEAAQVAQAAWTAALPHLHVISFPCQQPLVLFQRLHLYAFQGQHFLAFHASSTLWFALIKVSHVA